MAGTTVIPRFNLSQIAGPRGCAGSCVTYQKGQCAASEIDELQ